MNDSKIEPFKYIKCGCGYLDDMDNAYCSNRETEEGEAYYEVLWGCRGCGIELDFGDWGELESEEEFLECIQEELNKRFNVNTEE